MLGFKLKRFLSCIAAAALMMAVMAIGPPNDAKASGYQILAVETQVGLSFDNPYDGDIVAVIDDTAIDRSPGTLDSEIVKAEYEFSNSAPMQWASKGGGSFGNGTKTIL